MLKTITKSRKLLVAVLAVVGLALGAAGTTYAITTFATGTFSDRQYFATNDVAYTVPSATPSGTWVNVPDMARTISVPAGTSRLLDARFTAESYCSGGSYCSVRIVVINSAGATTELYPQAGTDFAFDSASTDLWESNAIERNSRTFLPAGTYTVRVQAAKVGNPTLRLDDMHLAVELIRP
jgi:hypothetical protein